MRIWVTGVGIVSPLGVGAQATMDSLCEGRTAFGDVSLFSVEGQRTRIAAEVRDPQFASPDKRLPGWSRTAAMALAAAREALEGAGLRAEHGSVDLVVGGTTGPMFESEELLGSLPDTGPICRDAARMIAHPLSVTTDFVRDGLGPFRRVRTLSSACSSGANAILLGALWITSGRCQRVLVGAADALCRLTFTGFNALGALDPRPCRPFDRTRAGLSLGEGAGFLVLERDDAAKERGACPIAELVGWSAAAEAHHITNPEPDGSTAARVIRGAMEVAGLHASDIDYVNAHGTATLLNDAMEIRALRNVLGDEMRRIAVSSIKGQIGHSLGASGAVEASVTALAISMSKVPPTGGLTEPSEECKANHVIGQARSSQVRAALTNSFGFGGLDSSLVFARPGYAPEKPREARRSVRVAGASLVGAAGQHGLRTARVYLQAGAEPGAGSIGLDDSKALDASRTRRLGHAERMMCMAIEAALCEADPASAGDRSRMGLIAGMASGSLDGAARFLKKARDKGPRLAPPADFPNLMVSASAGHASIFHGIRGPVLSATDAGMSVSSAVMTAIEILETSTADCMVAAGAAESSAVQDIASRAVDPCSPYPLTEGASCVVLVADQAVGGVRVLWHAQWDGDEGRQLALVDLPDPPDGARVVTAGQADRDLLEGTAWRDVDRVPIEKRAGRYEGVDGAAWVAAASLASSELRPLALAVSSNGDRGNAILFGAA